MLKRLVLFDIDGTLLTTNGLASAAMLASLKAVYGVDAQWDRRAMNGRTELWIAYRLLEPQGLSRAQVAAGLERHWLRYTAELGRRLTAEGVTVFPGVRKLLQALARRKDVLVGLLTGNIKAAAEKKLGVVGLGGFACGAFGQHHEDRAQLPAVALDAAERIAGRRFAGHEITIIGDTPSDIACGRHLAVNAIAVATGAYGLEELHPHQPDHLFADLSDTQSIMRAIESGGTS